MSLTSQFSERSSKFLPMTFIVVEASKYLESSSQENRTVGVENGTSAVSWMKLKEQHIVRFEQSAHYYDSLPLPSPDYSPQPSYIIHVPQSSPTSVTAVYAKPSSQNQTVLATEQGNYSSRAGRGRVKDFDLVFLKRKLTGGIMKRSDGLRHRQVSLIIYIHREFSQT